MIAKVVQYTHTNAITQENAIKHSYLRTTSVILALMLASSAFACGETPDKTPEQTEPETTETAKPTVDSDGYKLDSLPKLDFGGAIVHMFVPSSGTSVSEFEVETQTGDVIDDAVWERNTEVSDRLNINFEYTPNRVETPTVSPLPTA